MFLALFLVLILTQNDVQTSPQSDIRHLWALYMFTEANLPGNNSIQIMIDKEGDR